MIDRPDPQCESPYFTGYGISTLVFNADGGQACMW